MSDTSYTDYGVDFKGGLATAGDVTYGQWRETTTIDGQLLTAKVTEDKKALQVNLPKRSISVIEINLK